MRLRQCKAEFVKNQMEANGGDQKKFWKSIKDLLPNNKNAQNVINLINEDTNESVPVDKVAEYINQYFIGIEPKLAASLTQP